MDIKLRILSTSLLRACALRQVETTWPKVTTVGVAVARKTVTAVGAIHSLV